MEIVKVIPVKRIKRRSHLQRHGRKYASLTIVCALAAAGATIYQHIQTQPEARLGWIPRIPALHELFTSRSAPTEREDLTVVEPTPKTKPQPKIAAPKRTAQPSTMLHDTKLFMPLRGGLVFSTYGYRCRKNRAFMCRNHPAVDVAIEEGTPVFAAHAGTVKVGWHRELGHFMRIKGTHITTIYGHLKSAPAKSNGAPWRDDDEVTAETQIGRVGQTGNAEGPHLHFSLLIDGKYVNPEIHMPQFANLPRRAGLRTFAHAP